MAFEDHAERFKYAATQDPEDSIAIVIDGLVALVADMSDEIENLKRQMKALESRLPDPNQQSGG